MSLLASFLVLFLAPQDEELVKQYREQRQTLKDDDAEGILRLGDWCFDQGLIDLAESEWERVLRLNPDNAAAREKLGYKRDKDKWVEDIRREERKRYRTALRGLKFPKDKPKPKNEWDKKAIDFIFYRENWYLALDQLDHRLGLFSGSFEVSCQITKLPKGKIMKGWGSNGVGVVQIDLEEFSNLIRAYDEFESSRKDPNSTVLKAPVIKPTSLLIREICKVFMLEQIPPVMVDGMASYASKDPSILYYYTQLNPKFTAIHECPADKDQHVARGHAFFEYLEAKAGVTLVKFIASRFQNDRRDWKEIIETSLRKEWPEIAKDESEWSSKFIKDNAEVKKAPSK